MSTGQNYKEISENEPEAANQAASGSFRKSEPTLIKLNRKWFLGIYCLAAVLLILSLIFGFRLLQGAGNNPPPADTGLTAIQNATPNVMDESCLRAEVNHGPIPFEESLGAPLEETVKRLDHILIQSLIGASLDPRALSLLDVEERNDNGHGYLFQVIQIPQIGDSGLLFHNLGQRVDELQCNATLSRISETIWSLAVAGNPTHRLLLIPPRIKEVQPQAESKGLLTIVVDDLGESVDFARQLAELDFPVTFAIWPRSSKAVEVAELGHAKGLEILVHQPMQPEAYPKVNPGPGAVLTDMEEQAIREIIGSNLSMVPHAVGMNNHMGSAFTQDAEGMAAVIRELRSKNLFILDSLTHPDSQVLAQARRLGVRAYRRDVFLDVVRDVEAITFQLDKSQQLALRKGRAIAIGHPYSETLTALKQWGSRKDKRLDVVSLHELSFNNSVAMAGSQESGASEDSSRY